MLGIYAIIHKATGNRYVGQSNDVAVRLYTHKWHLNRGSHVNPKLQSAWSKYGETEFEFVVLEECDADYLTAREQFYIDQKPWFNVNLVAEAPPMLGRKHTAETRAKIGAAKKGGSVSAGTRAKMSASMKGLKRTEEAKAKMRMRRHTEETKAKMRGKKHTEETKVKMRGVRKNSKPVRCIETGQVFDSCSLAAVHFGGAAGYLWSHLDRRKPSFKGHTFEYA